MTLLIVPGHLSEADVSLNRCSLPNWKATRLRSWHRWLLNHCTVIGMCVVTKLKPLSSSSMAQEPVRIWACCKWNLTMVRFCAKIVPYSQQILGVLVYAYCFYRFCGKGLPITFGSSELSTANNWNHHLSPGNRKFVQIFRRYIVAGIVHCI